MIRFTLGVKVSVVQLRDYPLNEVALAHTARVRSYDPVFWWFVRPEIGAKTRRT